MDQPEEDTVEILPAMSVHAVQALRTLTLLPKATYDVLVREVHDGDTIRVLIPVEVKIRLDGIQAPELSTPKGPISRDWLTAKIGGKWAALTLGDDYKYGGERMGSIAINGTDVATEMIAKGLAVKWDGTGPRPVGQTSGE